MGSTVLYFAYGSNLHPGRLGHRTPSRRTVTTAMLPGYELRFHKRSDNPTDHSGKCDVVESVGAGGVLGVVYEIAASEAELLHEAEGQGYSNGFVDVHAGGTQITAFCYFARQSHVDGSLKPYAWYRDFLLYGAMHHRFPEYYLRRIAAVEVVRDHDESRGRRNRSLARARPAR